MLASTQISYPLSVYLRVRYFRGIDSNFNQSEARKHCFLASDWLKLFSQPGNTADCYHHSLLNIKVRSTTPTSGQYHEYLRSLVFQGGSVNKGRSCFLRE